MSGANYKNTTNATDLPIVSAKSSRDPFGVINIELCYLRYGYGFTVGFIVSYLKYFRFDTNYGFIQSANKSNANCYFNYGFFIVCCDSNHSRRALSGGFKKHPDHSIVMLNFDHNSGVSIAAIIILDFIRPPNIVMLNFDHNSGVSIAAIIALDFTKIDIPNCNHIILNIILDNEFQPNVIVNMFAQYNIIADMFVQYNIVIGANNFK